MIKYIVGYTGPGYIAQNIKDAIDYYNTKNGNVVFAAGNSNSEADYYPAFAIPRPTTFRESARRARVDVGTTTAPSPSRPSKTRGSAPPSPTTATGSRSPRPASAYTPRGASPA